MDDKEDMEYNISVVKEYNYDVIKDADRVKDKRRGEKKSMDKKRTCILLFYILIFNFLAAL